MSYLSLIGVELKKIRRSKILLILLIPVIMMWIPGILNADMNFDLRGIPITPENNFFIQGFMGMVWFMIPASLVICTVLLSQLIGGVLPVAARKVGIDPAVMASPLITTIVDTTTLLIYFNFARLVLHL